MTKTHDSDAIRQRILEAIVVLEEYTPKLQKIDNSLFEFNELITFFFKSLEKENNRLNIVSETSELKKNNLSKRLKAFFYFTVLVFTFLAGFMISFNYSDKYYFSDHRLKIVRELETENYKIRNQYYKDIRLIESLRDNGCLIEEKYLIAPQSKVKNTGISEDKKNVGIWLK